jgi:N-acetylated-alpha-linked acidic dipeptidase
MRIISSCLLAIAVSPLMFGRLHGEDATPLLGFTPVNASNQIALEKKFDALLNADDQKVWLEQMTAAPNHVGSPHDKANADFMLAQFKEWGWDARIETFDVLYPTPKKVSVELVAPTNFTAKLREPVVTGDRTSDQIADELPPYNVYGMITRTSRRTELT